MTCADVSQHIYTNKEHGKLSAAASLGLVLLWDVDGGLVQIDKVCAVRAFFWDGRCMWIASLYNTSERDGLLIPWYNWFQHAESSQILLLALSSRTSHFGHLDLGYAMSSIGV